MTTSEFLARAFAEARMAVERGAPIMPAAAVAHAANESTFGRSALTVQGRNLFGTKAIGQHTQFWRGNHVEMPTWEVVDGRRVDIVARFRAYGSWADSFGDYGDIIRRVYPTSAGALHDAPFLAGLFLTGPRKWATDPAAFDKVVRILAAHGNALVLPPPAPVDQLRVADTVVLHHLSWADRVRVLLDGGAKDGVALRSGEGGRSFVWRATSGKVDVRRTRGGTVSP